MHKNNAQEQGNETSTPNPGCFGSAGFLSTSKPMIAPQIVQTAITEQEAGSLFQAGEWSEAAGAYQGIANREPANSWAPDYLLPTNRHMRDVLTAKEYNFKYEEFPATHRELNWEDQLVKGLKFLSSK